MEWDSSLVGLMDLTTCSKFFKSLRAQWFLAVSRCPGLKLLMSKIKTTEPARCSHFPKFALIFLTLNSSKRWQGLWATAGSLLRMACHPLMTFPILRGSVKPLSSKRTSSLELWLHNNRTDFFFSKFYLFILTASEGLLRGGVCRWWDEITVVKGPFHKFLISLARW